MAPSATLPHSEAANNMATVNMVEAAQELIDPEVLPKLDPVFVKYFVEVLAPRPPTHKVPIREIRQNPQKYGWPWAIDTTGWPRVIDRELSSEDGSFFPVKIYYPDPIKHGDGPYPVHLNYHGGGFIFGDLTGDAPLCLKMCEGVGLVVVDVNYRHCPESPFGKGIEDAWAALQWVKKAGAMLNMKVDSISVGGISAGGWLACVLQHLARDHSIELKLCIASAPGTDDVATHDDYSKVAYASFQEYRNAPCLNWSRLSYMAGMCFPKTTSGDVQQSLPDWWRAPIRATNWGGLCDTFIITAECDPLRDEGESYGMKLIGGGNKVQFKRYLTVPHPFMHIKALKQAQDYDRDINLALKSAHCSG